MKKAIFILCLSLLWGKNGFAGIAYLTDVEGMYQKLTKFLANSPAFALGGDGLYHLKAGEYFVYGGDPTDRADGDRKIIQELSRLKKETPARVVLIIGNRDLGHFMRSHFIQSYIPNPNKVPYFLKARIAELSSDEGRAYDPSLLGEALKGLQADLLPTGLYGEYLKHGQLIARIDNTLFVHGAVNEKNFGWDPMTKRVETDLDRWILHLHKWYGEMFQKWEKGDASLNAEAEQFEEDKIEQKGNSPLDIVMDRNVGNFNNPYLPSKETIESLIKAGVVRMVVGHTPMDQIPVVLRFGDKFEIIYADNSFSKNEGTPHSIYITGNHFDTVKIGVQHNGVLSGVPLILNFDLKLGDGSPLGKRLADGSLVIAPVGKEYLTFQLGGKFSTHYNLVTPTEAQAGMDPFESTVGLCQKVAAAAL